jgi:hypothetical protein
MGAMAVCESSIGNAWKHTAAPILIIVSTLIMRILTKVTENLNEDGQQ